MSNLVIHQFSLGTWDNFLYFIGDKNTREVFVVDPAWGSDKIVAEAEKNIEKNQNHMSSRNPNIIRGLEYYFQNR